MTPPRKLWRRGLSHRGGGSRPRVGGCVQVEPPGDAPRTSLSLQILSLSQCPAPSPQGGARRVRPEGAVVQQPPLGLRRPPPRQGRRRQVPRHRVCPLPPPPGPFGRVPKRSGAHPRPKVPRVAVFLSENFTAPRLFHLPTHSPSHPLKATPVVPCGLPGSSFAKGIPPRSP